MTIKGQKINRPAYKEMWLNASAERTRLSALVDEVARGAQESYQGRVKAETIAGATLIADTRHKRWMIAFGVLDVVLAATMLWVLLR